MKFDTDYESFTSMKFEGMEAVIQTEFIETQDGGKIPLELKAVKTGYGFTEDGAESVEFEAWIDGVRWYVSSQYHHAVILYTMLKKHVTEYMHYKTVEPSTYMTVKDLSREALTKLKQKHYITLLEERDEGVSYDELARIDELVSDEEIYKAYEHTLFVSEDFDL